MDFDPFGWTSPAKLPRRDEPGGATRFNTKVIPATKTVSGTSALQVLAASGLTSTRVPFADSAGRLVDSSAMTFASGSGRLSLATTGSAAGILIGGDAPLYRNGTTQLGSTAGLRLDVGALATDALILNSSTSNLLFDMQSASGVPQLHSTSAARIAFDCQGTAAPVAGDFSANERVIFTRASDTSFRISMKGADGTVRHATVAVA